MAKKQTVVISDDLDGATIDPTNHRPTHFSIDGKAYEIDLSPENRAKLEDALSPFVANGRRAGKAKRATTRGGPKSNNQVIREWAQQNGYTVAARGKLSTEVVTAYESAR
ncbi:MAG: hypothetical protein DI630_13290 [Gordonia sp. (in: high G+C Gram-positive bacteria)]|nr:MAG: hypothetical protein DI630_13290 [Gordonia sp. (in: high G+C Gram-positive bacteria)]